MPCFHAAMLTSRPWVGDNWVSRIVASKLYTKTATCHSCIHRPIHINIYSTKTLPKQHTPTFLLFVLLHGFLFLALKFLFENLKIYSLLAFSVRGVIFDQTDLFFFVLQVQSTFDSHQRVYIRRSWRSLSTIANNVQLRSLLISFELITRLDHKSCQSTKDSNIF